MSKYRLMFLSLFAMMAISLVACSDDDDSSNRFENLPMEVQKAFLNKYPDSRATEWDREGMYYVIEFKRGKFEAEAWFDGPTWFMTETDVSYSKIPSAVNAALKSSVYASWHVDDVDVVERNAMPTLFIIEVEKGKIEVDLYYLEDGTLIKEVVDNDGDNSNYLPRIPAEITKFINDSYPGARILDVELDNSIYEVEIIHENIKKEIKLDKSFKWILTKWDVAIRDITEVVRLYIEKNYPGYKIDDVEIVYAPSNIVYYEIELEKGNSEIDIRITPEGEIVR